MIKSEHPSFGRLPERPAGDDDSLVRNILRDYPVPIDMSTPSKMYHVLMELKRVVCADVPGHVVELGCFAGGTTVQLRRLLDALGETRELHVYDSWEGVPDPTSQDMPADPGVLGFVRGACETPREAFERMFALEGLPLPHVHSGWFASIPDNQYPMPIAFAFFDGDMYSSIIDSFNKVYPKLSRGARVVIDDYEWERLPGVKMACQDFLRDKPERELALPDYFGPGLGGGALVVKL